MDLEQPDLLAWKPSHGFRNSDPETSRLAAERASMGAHSGRMLALRTLIEKGPLTDFELAAATGKAQTSIGCRRKDIRDMGFVEVLRDSTGSKVTRPSPSGSPALVWTVTAAGKAYHAEHHR